jgi:hypothetical protein
LAGILWRYQELLATFAAALDSAIASTPINPYQSIPRAFLKGFQIYLPSFVRQAKVSSRQFDRVPNALARDLAGAQDVLAELETLTPAQLSAIEECHRVNVRRLWQRSVLRWSLPGKIIVLVTAIGAVAEKIGAVAEKIGGVKPSDLLPLIRGVNLTGDDLQSTIVQTIILFAVLVVIVVGINLITFLPILHRVKAFEDILNIAKAYRNGLGEKTKQPAAPSLTVTG